MRPELEQIQKIDQYLAGELSPADRAAFEAQLAADANLREALRLQTDLRAAIHRIPLRQAIQRARQHFHRTQWLRWGGFGAGLTAITAVIIGAFFLLRLHAPIRTGLTAATGEVYTIDLTHDTLLKTAHGALIQIPRGSIDAGEAHDIRLAVKEAYTLADMIRYGLTTQANGQPLSSGGMIDIRPADSTPGSGATSAARIVRPLTVSLPTNRIETNMSRYNGVVDGQGKINWTNPRPLTDTAPRQDLVIGHTLFETNCAPCHSVTHAVTGPALAYIADRRPREWLFGYIRDNQKMISSDCYSQYVYTIYNKTAMNAFHRLSGEDIDRILAYIENQSPLIDSNKVPNYTRKYDSCREYRRMTGLLEENRQALIAGNDIRTEVRRNNEGTTITDTTVLYTTPAPDTMVTVVGHPSIYYTFTVESFGWYNVDVLMKDLPGIQPAELVVTMPAEYAAEVNVFLAIPGRKILAEGGFVKNSKTDFAFYTDDGQIPLPPGEQAYVFATGEYNGSPVFAINGFTLSGKQHIELQPAAMTTAQITDIVGHIDLNQLSIRVADSRNAAKIRAIDTSLAAIARFKPVDCDCDCKLDEARDSAPVEGTK